MWSSTSPWPSCSRACLRQQVRGVRHRLIPPVTTTSLPVLIIRSASSIALIDEAQTLLIVSAGTSFGMPAATAAWRAGAWPAPACSTWPMTTYPTSPGSTPARSRAALMAAAPSAVAGSAASPPPSFPNGVRTAATMTERLMASA
jgi:hypothetical protein